MKFLMTVSIRSLVTGEFEPFTQHTISFDEEVTDVEAAVALVKAERDIIIHHIRVSIERGDHGD